MCLT
ncbi:hypothetical protein SOVF_021140 isoform A, partial [Spinacia oleracea]|jgi:hypothetical protein